MNVKTLFLVLFASLTGVAVKAQSIFFIQYHFTSIADTSLYSVFLVRNEDGTGFYRVRFTDHDTHEDMLVDLDMKEMYFKDKNGQVDENKIYFKGFNPQVLVGNANYKYYPEMFWFYKDKNTGLYEPWAVTSPDEHGVAQGKFVDRPELVEQADLTEDFVGSFFLEDEEFYQSLFKTVQRSLTPTQKKDVLHLVLVANTDDELIGHTCRLDKDRTYKTYKDLAEFLGIGFNPKVISGSDYNKQNVQNAVSALQPNPHDIVIFYYSGHGFSDAPTNRLFPNMALSNKSYEDIMKNTMNVEDVFRNIQAKGARFNLVYSDCCNNSTEDRVTLTCDVPRTRNSPLGWNLENCKRLFMDEKPMSILMTAAQRGEQSTGNGTFGGFFTNQFRTNLISYMGFMHFYPNWKTLLEESTKETTVQAENTRCSEGGEALKTYKQHPVFRIIQ